MVDIPEDATVEKTREYIETVLAKTLDGVTVYSRPKRKPGKRKWRKHRAGL